MATTAEIVGLRQHAERMSERLPPLLVAAERVASTVAQGVHGRRRVGVGETFWQYRSYQPGDEASAIDWRMSARTSHLYVREQEWEAAESVWLWCDLSRSMQYRSDRVEHSKAERAIIITLALAALLIRGGERIAFLGAGRRPTGGRPGLSAFTRDIVAAGSEPESMPPLARLPRYARLVIVSDFWIPVRELRERLRTFVGMGVRGHLVQVVDPSEETLPYRGRVLFEGLEQDGSALIGSVDGVRGDYQRLVHAHREALGGLARAFGWTFAHHETMRPPETPLLALFMALATKASA